MNEYDIVIVGGGHNGLTCGCYLAKAGQKVGVFERRHNIGGGCCTEEVTLPGFKHNLHNFIHAWIHTGPVYKELELEKYGSKYVYPETQWGMVYEDGKALVQYLDVDSTCKELGKFSKKDAREYRDLIRYFEDMKDIIFGALFAPPLPPSVLDGLLEGTKEGLEFLKLMKSNPKTLCNDIFESEQIKAWALFCTTQGGTPHDIYGNGIYLPAVFCLTHIKPYGMSVGGSRMLAEGMTKCLEDHGGKVFKNTHVSKIIVENGNATGIELSDGTKIKAKVVVSNTEPQQTFLKLVGEEYLDNDFITKVKRFKWDEIVLFTPHLALNELPDWIAAKDNPDINKCLWVGVGVENQDILQSQFNDMRLGKLPEDIAGCACMPTSLDPTQAPPGKHTAFWWQYVTYDLKEGPEHWDVIKEEYADRIMEVWRKYAPNMGGDNVLARYVYTPYDIEKEVISMVHGAMMLGEMSQDQLMYFRPFAGWSQYRMPIKNLYLCGGSVHPSGGCSGAPGYNAAGAICEDLKIKKWWSPVSFGRKK